MAAAEARAKALVEGHHRTLQQLAESQLTLACEPMRADGENIETASSERPRSHQPNQALFREAVSVCAYYKAEHRGFEPGLETDDWLEAERELIAVSTWSGRESGV